MPATIFLHLAADAPDKPAPGAPCNGCGICCSLDTCPPGRLRFWQKQGPCPALSWSTDDRRYYCGLLSEPGRYIPHPQRLTPLLRTLLRRWIAAGSGCDSTTRLLSDLS